MSHGGGNVGGPQERRIVASLGRAELEDRHVSLLEENHLLKKHVWSQEEKMKKMATKLLKLAADERREAKRDGQPPSVMQVRELETEIQDLVAKIRQLEKTNTSLHNKVALLKQQCDSRGRRRTAYDHIQSRITTGVVRRTQRGFSPAQSSPGTPRYGRSLLEEARRDNQELEDLVLRLKQEVAVLTAEAEKNQEQLKLQAAEHEQRRLSLEQQLQTLSTSQQKRVIEEDVEVIRVQREAREKSDKLLVLQSQCSALERNMETVKINNSKLLHEIENLNTRLKEEQSRSVELQARLNSEAVMQGKVAELEQVVSDLQTEREILKRTNDRLLKSPFVEDVGSEYRGQVRAFQESSGELGSVQEAHHTPSAPTVTSLSREREVSQQLAQKLREAREAYHHVHRLNNEAERGTVSEVLGQRVRNVGVNTEQAATAAAGTAATSVATTVQKEEELPRETDLRRELFELRLSQVEAAAELEKTRHLLAAQRAVNLDCQKEIVALRDQITRRTLTHTLPPDNHQQHSTKHKTRTHTISRDNDTGDSERAQLVGEREESGRDRSKDPQREKKKKGVREGKQGGKREHSQTVELHRLTERTESNKDRSNTHPCLTELSQMERTRILNNAQPSAVVGTGEPQRPTSLEREGAAQPLGPVRVRPAARGGSMGQKVTEKQLQQAERSENQSSEVVESPGDDDNGEISEEVSVSSSTQSLPEIGTPSTSTPMKPPVPPSLPGKQDTPPPFFSSISVITEAPPTLRPPEGSVMVGGCEEGSGSGGDSVSVTVTELSEEEGSDTMFEETLPHYATESTVSGRSLATPTTPTRPTVRVDNDEGSPVVSLTSGLSPSSMSEDEESSLLTPRAAHQHQQQLQPLSTDTHVGQEVMSITIHSLALEPGCSLLTRRDVQGYFMEFQLLDYDYAELETPSVVVPPPPSSLSLHFNFRKDLVVGPTQKALLVSALNSSADNPDRKVVFTVVSDPVDQEGECEEVGTAEVDLSTILQSGRDIVNGSVEVVSCDKESETVGQLIISISAVHILQTL